MQKSASPPARNGHAAPRLVFAASLLLLLQGAAQAQPGSEAGNYFGDRQTGKFGDPGQGYFGNPAAGDFDKHGLRAPPPGAQASGKVYPAGKTPDASPYISLPAPKDAPAPLKAPAKKRKPKKATSEGTAP